MDKLHKFLKIGLPIIGATVVGGGAVTAIAVSSIKTLSINRNLSNLDDEKIVKEIDYSLPTITEGLGRVALMPTYSSNVIDKFGAVYEPDGNDVLWPRLISKNVSKEDIKTGNVSKDDLLTFDQLIPNVSLAKLVAESIFCTSSDSSVLLWVEGDGTHPSRWVNQLAEYSTSTIDGRDWVLWFECSAFISTAAIYDNNIQTTCRDPNQLLCAMLMNPFVYDFFPTTYEDGKIYNPYPEFEDFQTIDEQNIPDSRLPVSAYSHVSEWDLSNNGISTLPRGLFQFVHLDATNLLSVDNKHYEISFETNDICILNPLQLFGKRKLPEGKTEATETWSDRIVYGKDTRNYGEKFLCNIDLNISDTLININQDSWTKYAGQLTRNSNAGCPEAKSGWNFVNNIPLYNLYIYTFDDESKSTSRDYVQVAYDYEDNCLPVYLDYQIGDPIGPISRIEEDPLNQSENYGLAVDCEKISAVVMSVLTNKYTNTNIWASNEKDNIVDKTLDCLQTLNWISLPTANKIAASGKSNNMNGTCAITVGEDSLSDVDITTTFEITGFNEATSGIILSACLAVIFILVLFFAIKALYRNYHPKLTKDELNFINNNKKPSKEEGKKK